MGIQAVFSLMYLSFPRGLIHRMNQSFAFLFTAVTQSSARDHFLTLEKEWRIGLRLRPSVSISLLPLNSQGTIGMC
jgi:hypothetical protein